MATKTLQVNTGGNVSWDYEKDPVQLSIVVDKAGTSFATVYQSTATDGTKATKVYTAAITIANGAANTVFNFASFTDSFGDTINMTKLRVMYIHCTTGAGNFIITSGTALWTALGYTGLPAATIPLVATQKRVDECPTNNALNCTNTTVQFQNTNTGSSFNCNVIFVGE